MFNEVTNADNLNQSVSAVFGDCQKYLEDIGIKSFSCRLIILSDVDYEKLREDYKKRFGKEISEFAFTDSSMRGVLGYDIVYINLEKHFANLPIETSIVNLGLSFLEEFIHSSDPCKSETETVEIVFSAISDFLGVELYEETKKEARLRAKRFNGK